MSDFSSFPERLKMCIKESGCTQIDLARRLGISKHSLTKYMGGRIPESAILYELSRHFNKPMEWFLVGDLGESGSNVRLQEFKKAEAITDPDFKEMCDILQMLMLAGDADLRGWTKIQFKNAFKDYLAMIEEEKKLHA